MMCSFLFYINLMSNTSTYILILRLNVLAFIMLMYITTDKIYYLRSIFYLLFFNYLFAINLTFLLCLKFKDFYV